MLITFIKPDFVFKNDAGCLVQLVHEGWKQINVISSNAGAVRGNHYHKFNKECFYIIEGAFKLTLKKDNIVEEYEIKSNDMFYINPFVIHTFSYTKNTILVSMYDNGIEIGEDEKDIWSI